MAQTVQIEVTLDDQGVATGVQNIRGSLNDMGSSLQKTGQQGNLVFTAMKKNILDAHVAGQLFVRTTGIEMPRALEGVMARSQVLGPLLRAALPVAIFAAVIPVLVEIGEKIASTAQALGGMTEETKKFNEENLKANQSALVDPKTLVIARQNIDSLRGQIQEKQRFIDSLNKEDALTSIIFGYGTKTAELAAQRNKLQQELIPLLEKTGELAKGQNIEDLKAWEQISLIGKEGFAKIQQEKLNAEAAAGMKFVNDEAGYQTAVTRIETEATAKRADLLLKLHDETRKLQNEVVLGYLEGDDKIIAKAEQAYAEKLALSQRGVIDSNTLYNFDVANHDKEQQEILDSLRKRIHAEVELSDQFHAQTLAAVDRAQTQELQGTARIYAEEKQLLDHYRQEYDAAMQKAADNDSIRKKLSMDEDARVAAVKASTIEQVQKLLEKASLETQALNEKAAIAMLPPWQQADAQIVADFQDAQRKLQEALRTNMISQSDYDQRLRDEAVLANTKMANDLATQLQSVFDDITSGNIGQTILKNFEKFFFQIAAQWLITTGTMKEYSSLLGPLLGINLPGAVGGGAGLGMGGFGMSATSPLPGMLGMGGTAASTSFLGGGSTLGAMGGLGALAVGGGGTGTGLTSFLGAGAGSDSTLNQLLGVQAGTNAAGYNVNAVNQLLGIPALSGVPGLSGAGALGKGGIFSSLAAMAPMLALMGGGYLGNKLGGTPGMLGGGIAGLAGAAALGIGGSAGMLMNTWQMLSFLGPTGATALMAGAGGGLLGFGVGQNYGMLPGAIVGGAAGAGIGAIIASLAGLGPAGWIVGGIVGILGGIFGGLFGGSARRKAADTFVQQQETAVDQIEAQFKSYQVDYPTALTDLEQIRSNAEEQLRKLKDEGKKAYSRTLSPYIDKIEAELKGYEDERERRETLAVAPPQFAEGGYVSGRLAGWRSDGGIQAIVHPGEYVVNPAATARNRAALENMNAGGANVSAGGDVHIHLHTIDGASTMTWLKNGGGDTIAKYARGRRLEGRGF